MFHNNILLLALILGSEFVHAQNNPFLRPGSKNAKPPVISRPAPPPPKPIPVNPNIEFRGYYEFQGQWRIALFDKAKNQGFWITKGETIEGIEAEVESFNPDTDEIRLKGGRSLKLKESDKTSLPVPSGQAKKPTPPIPVKPKPTTQVPKPGIPPPRRR